MDDHNVQHAAKHLVRVLTCRVAQRDTVIRPSPSSAGIRNDGSADRDYFEL